MEEEEKGEWEGCLRQCFEVWATSLQQLTIRIQKEKMPYDDDADENREEDYDPDDPDSDNMSLGCINLNNTGIACLVNLDGLSIENIHINPADFHGLNKLDSLSYMEDSTQTPLIRDICAELLQSLSSETYLPALRVIHMGTFPYWPFVQAMNSMERRIVVCSSLARCNDCLRYDAAPMQI